MPVWLRKFTHNKINQFYKEREEATKKSEKTWVSGEAKEEAKRNTKISPPDYITKNIKKP